MTDRELLELAAKAAGYTETKVNNIGWFYVCVYPGHNGDDSDKEWELFNPLTDDGDALRLAVKLGLTVGPHLGASHAGVAPCPDDFEDGKFPTRIAEIHYGDPYAATRRAIVRAAAEIGKGKA